MEQYEEWVDPTLNLKDLNYVSSAIEVLNGIKSEWAKVKKHLPKDDVELHKAVDNFEKYLNYFYEV